MSTARRVCIFTLVSFVVFALPTRVHAAVSSCSANISKTNVPVSTSNNFSIELSNTSASDTIVWVKITRPSSNFTIESYSIGGWSVSMSSDMMTLTGGSLGPDSRASFDFIATTGSSEAASADWTVQVSDTAGGASPISCTGTLGTSIGASYAPDSAPTISNIVISDIVDSSVKITWTTDESSTSIIDYGTSDSYGNTKSDGASVTSHSLNLSTLTANTLYHYNVKSADSGGNTGESGDNTFTTAKYGTSGTTVTVVTGTPRPTLVPTPTITPTPTPVPDRAPPTVTLTTDVSKPFVRAPTIFGEARDPSGVTATMHYSVNDGRNWAPVDTVGSPGEVNTTFSFTPIGLLDDNYTIRVRTSDGKGNTGVSPLSWSMVIDRLPPTIGGSILTLGPQVINPTTGGTVFTVSGLSQKLTFSAVGGPTRIKLLGNRSDLEIPANLHKNPDTGLWSAMLSFRTPGTYQLSAHAVDGAGNTTDRELSRVTVLPYGTITDGRKPVSHATVTVYFLDNTSKRFIEWDGRSYGQKNPQVTDESGAFAFYLPRGTYYVSIRAGGYRMQVSSIFTLFDATPVTTSFALVPSRTLRIGPWVIPLPDFRLTKVDVKLVAPQDEESDTHKNEGIGGELPYFSFPYDGSTITSTNLHGKPTDLVFFNTWDPQSASQLAILQDLAAKKEIHVVGIVPQETESSVAIYRKRGGYTLPIVADPDGALVEAVHLETVPTHVFLNRKGVVGSVIPGVLTKEQILNQFIR